MKYSRHGFTIVELLIVIVVIAILAAISIASYNGIQARAHKVSVTADLSNLSKQLELYRATNTTFPYGSTSNATSLVLNTIRYSVNAGSYAQQGGNMLYITDIGASTGTKYALLAVPKFGTALMVSSWHTAPEPYTGSAPFPGSGYGEIAQALGFDSLASGNTVTYNAYANGEGFRIWY